MAGSPPQTVRVDKWLWAVRVYKTRSAANDACSTGRVMINDEQAKPAAKVKIGDLVTARRRDRTVAYEVVALIEKRVGAAKAAECVNDVSPPAPEPTSDPTGLAAMRERGEGRPTKRDRRQLDRLRRRQ